MIAQWASLGRFHPTLAIGALVVASVVLALLAALPRVGRVGRLAAVGAAVSVFAVERSLIGVALGASVAGACVIAAVGGRARQPALVVPLALCSLGGVWAAVPDTELPVVVLGGAVAVFVAWAAHVGGVVPTAGDRLVAVGLVVVGSLVGSPARPEVIGGIACVGLLLAPLPRRPGTWSAGVLVSIHVLVVLLSSRVVTRMDRPVALVVAPVLVGLGVLASWAVGRSAAFDRPRRDAEPT